MIRTEIPDNAVNKFINKYQTGVIIDEKCGLDTRYFRLKTRDYLWFELIFQMPSNFERIFFYETEDYHRINKSVFFSWFNEIPENIPVLIIAEGLLIYFLKVEVVELLNTLAENSKIRNAN